jgi:hypothetical protein
MSRNGSGASTASTQLWSPCFQEEEPFIPGPGQMTAKGTSRQAPADAIGSLRRSSRRRRTAPTGYGHLRHHIISMLSPALARLASKSISSPPEYGPRVYLTGILTEFEADKPMAEQVCIGAHACASQRPCGSASYFCACKTICLPSSAVASGRDECLSLDGCTRRVARTRSGASARTALDVFPEQAFGEVAADLVDLPDQPLQADRAARASLSSETVHQDTRTRAVRRLSRVRHLVAPRFPERVSRSLADLAFSLLG